MKMKTRDGYEVTIGMWVSDTTGIYEVKQIDGYERVTLREVIFEEDSDGYTYGDYRWLTRGEMKHMSYE